MDKNGKEEQRWTVKNKEILGEKGKDERPIHDICHLYPFCPHFVC